MTTHHSNRYRQIEVAGDPLQMGLAIGEDAREEVRGLAAITLDRVNKTATVSREDALAVAAASLPLAEAYHPHACQELRGVARATGLPLEELMLLQVRNQLVVAADAGCTSLSLVAPATDTPIVAQNWDNDPALDPFTIVLVRRPSGRPASMSLTQAGLVGYIGCNDAGLALCLNSLPAPSRRVGVPHYFVVRAILESRGRDEAAAQVRRAHRAIPASIMLGTPEGPANLEVTLDHVETLVDETGLGVVTHTNHCLHPQLLAINDRFPELIQSRPRKLHIDALLAGAPRPIRVASVQAMLADHDGQPLSICRHTNDEALTGYWQTVFSVVMESARKRMHVSRGQPCAASYHTYEMSGGTPSQAQPTSALAERSL